MSNGKGSKPRPFNKKLYDSNFESINWDGKIRCINCNLVIDKSNLEKYPNLYIEYGDGTVEHRECNFN